jgi:hypothetical protein
MVRLAVLRVAGPSIGDWQFKLATGSATIFEVVDGELTLVSPINRLSPDPHKAAAATVEPTSGGLVDERPEAICVGGTE